MGGIVDFFLGRRGDTAGDGCTSVSSWARSKASDGGEKKGCATYQRVEGDEADSVAKFAGSRWLDTVGIPHRSFAGGRIDPVEDECVDLGQTEKNGDVREVRQDVGSVGVGARGSEVVGVRRNRRFTVTATADSGELFRQPGGAIGSGARGEMARREGAI
jgi:hypothetical protein